MSDLISRQAAIDALDKRFDSIPMEQTTEILQLRKDLRKLPSAQRTGRWIDKIYGCKECSECGYIWLDFGCPNYCPKCGARMDGEGDDTD